MIIYLDQSQGIEVDSYNPQEPEPTGGEEPACSVSATKKKRKTRLTSPVWPYFVKVKVSNPIREIEENAQCKFCKDLLSAKSANGTGHLNRHRSKCMPKNTNTTDVGVRGEIIQTQLS